MSPVPLQLFFQLPFCSNTYTKPHTIRSTIAIWPYFP
uniref:Uncharacterized protein n=1 Tax=virus sp. ctLl75 TaxID=2828249 RepID=A0A8S5RAB2_9VIRU|nr:MAG TPA: hypothetical protein [virus sp. ctLl75]